jgi:hypothetical protein
LFTTGLASASPFSFIPSILFHSLTRGSLS